MDVQTLCLGVLERGDATGYQIRKEFETGCFALIQTAALGSIYPALAKLHAQGLITAVASEASGGAGSTAKKTYRITPAGRQRLLAALHEPPAPDQVRSDFFFVLVYCHLLPQGYVRWVMERRLANDRAELARIEAMTADGTLATLPPGERITYGMGRSFYETVIAYLEAHKEELIAAAVPETGASADPGSMP